MVGGERNSGKRIPLASDSCEDREDGRWGMEDELVTGTVACSCFDNSKLALSWLGVLDTVHVKKRFAQFIPSSTEIRNPSAAPEAIIP
jgi:hypothetical protein